MMRSAGNFCTTFSTNQNRAVASPTGSLKRVSSPRSDYIWAAAEKVLAEIGEMLGGAAPIAAIAPVVTPEFALSSEIA